MNIIFIIEESKTLLLNIFYEGIILIFIFKFFFFILLDKIIIFYLNKDKMKKNFIIKFIFIISKNIYQIDFKNIYYF